MEEKRGTKDECGAARMTGSDGEQCLLFDLDGTLYLESNGYVQHCRKQACDFLCEKFDWSAEQAEEKRKLALKTSNQTVKGLRTLGYDLDDKEFVTHMRSGVEKFLNEDPKLQAFLSSLPQKKFVFTNTREVEATLQVCLSIVPGGGYGPPENWRDSKQPEQNFVVDDLVNCF